MSGACAKSNKMADSREVVEDGLDESLSKDVASLRAILRESALSPYPGETHRACISPVAPGHLEKLSISTSYQR